MVFVIDIESNGLLDKQIDYSSFPYKLKDWAKLWCVVIKNINTGEVHRLVKNEVTKKKLKEILSECTVLIAHNGVKYDFFALKLFGVFDYTVGYPGQRDTLFGKEITIVDTLILSRLFNPDRLGGHSLSAWGDRLGEPKTDLRAVYIEENLLDKRADEGAEFQIFSDHMVDYCITPNHKLLKSDLKWTEARNLKVGDKVLGFDEFNKKSSGRKYRTSIIEKIKYENRPVFEVKLSSGKIFEVTEDHKWLTGQRGSKWVETKNLRPKTSTKKYCSKIPKLIDMWEEDKSYEAGWLSGMFDGEGSLAKDRFTITIAQRPTKTLERLEKILKQKYSGKISNRYTKRNSDCISIGVKGNAPDKLKFLGEIRPERLMEKFTFEKMGRVENKKDLEEVISITPVGLKEIIKIQTSTGTFICDGYPMHNCQQDVIVNEKVFKTLIKEIKAYPKWKNAIRQELKLADLANYREHFGFDFDKDYAIECFNDLTHRIKTISDKINPILPERKLNMGEAKFWTPPARQIKADLEPTSTMWNFTKRVGGELKKTDKGYLFIFDGKEIKLPFSKQLVTSVKSTVEDMDAVKEYLIELGWIPSEWTERDLTKDAGKKSIPYQKRIEALDRWLEETFTKEKFKSFRLEELEIKTQEELREELAEQLKDNRPVRVRTSPPIRVGVERELCPNLLKLGEKVAFAQEYANLLTYKYRKSAIAGGETEDIDLSKEKPTKGYLATYREDDGRIATPAIELGAASGRYIHKNIVNIPRTTSLYGKELRKLFGAGKDFIQFGYDFSGLENRIQGNYIYKYPQGKELSEALTADKPNDSITLLSLKLNMERSEAKSINYAAIYGAQPKKIAKMLGKSLKEGKKIYNEFWEAVPALLSLKKNLEKHWENNNKEFIVGLDGRKILTRSQHSLLNFLFQSGGVILAKYVLVLTLQKLENLGYCINPFERKPDVCEMISMHDEAQLALRGGIIKFKTFESEAEAKRFVSKWEGAKLSSINKGNNCWYVVMPNDISNAIRDSIKEAEKLLNLNVSYDFEYAVGSNWGDCH